MLTVDIEKAYDTVPYDIIEEVLRRHNCPDKMVKLVRDAHLKRMIKIKIRDNYSEAICPKRGVAQGSPLSCILFVMAMQPLLNRLEAETVGIVGAEDDTMYVDDLTLLTCTAKEMQRKWQIIKEFEEYSGMMVNVGKCEYDTTEVNPDQWFTSEGVKNMRLEKDDEAVRILGYMLNTRGERKQQLEKITTSIRIAANMMRRKLMTPEMAKGVVNMIICTRLNYVAQMYEIPARARDKMEKQCNKLVKAQHGYPMATATQKLYTRWEDGGDGIEHPGDVADRALIHEYFIALNSEVEERMAKIMKQNIEKVNQLAGGDPQCGGKIRTEYRAKNKNHHKVWCPMAPHWQANTIPAPQSGKKTCTCDTERYQDTMHMQCIRALKRQGYTLRKTNEYESELTSGLKEGERLRQMAKKVVVEGQIIQLEGKQGEGRYIAQVMGQWAPEEPAEGSTRLQLRWYPKLYIANARGQGWTNIFGDKLEQDPELSKEDKEEKYISPEELWKQVDNKVAQKTAIKAGIEAQWDLKSEYGKTPKLEDTPGIGHNYLWEIETEDWDIRLIRNAERELESRKAGKSSPGTGRKRGVRVKYTTVRIKAQNIGPEVSFKRNAAQADKSNFRRMLGDDKSNGMQIEVWTDGAQGRAQKTAGVTADRATTAEGDSASTGMYWPAAAGTLSAPNARLGSGLRVIVDGKEDEWVDMAWRVLGVATNNGAEMAPIAKIVEWLKVLAYVTVYTDSDSTIKLINKIKKGKLKDRDRINHPDRNAVMMIQQAMKRNPGVLERLKLVKVVSHTGVEGNEAADTCAGMAINEEEAKEYAATVWIREALDYVLIDEDTQQPMMGNARKLIKLKQTNRRLKTWQDIEKYRVQGKFAREWAKVKAMRRKKVYTDITASQKLSKAINSIALCQDEWGKSTGHIANKKWECKVCREAVGCAAHKIKCIGQGKNMVMAIMRGRWTGRAEFKQVGNCGPEWLEAPTQKLRDGHLWYQLEGAGWTPSEVTESLAWGFDKANRSGRVNEQNIYKEFCKTVQAVKRREEREGAVWDRTYEGNNGQISCIRMKEIEYRPSPKWLMECLLGLGIHRQLYTTAMDITPIMPENHSRYKEDEILGMKTGEAGVADLYRGGTCSWINTSRKELRARCMEVQQAVKALNKANELARHVAVVLCDKSARKLITSHGGRIMASWPERNIRLYETAWRTEVPEGQRKWRIAGKTLKGMEMVLAVWQTNATEEGVRIEDEFWKELHSRSRQATGGYPIVRAEWGPIYGKEVERELAEGETGEVPSTQSISKKAWMELEKLEADHPYIFWSGRVGKLKHLTMEDPERIEGVRTGQMEIKVRVAGQELVEKKSLKHYKTDVEVYGKIKKSAAQRRKAYTEATERIEQDIIEGLQRMLESHWELASERLVQEGSWTGQERRRARRAYWEQRTAWKRKRRKK
jgi:ribonuclease HI